MFFGVLGLHLDLNGVTVAPAKSTLFRELKTVLRVKGGELEISYKNAGAGKRKITVNGKAIQAKSVTLRNEELYGKRMSVEIID